MTKMKRMRAMAMKVMMMFAKDMTSRMKRATVEMRKIMETGIRERTEQWAMTMRKQKRWIPLIVKTVL